MQIDRELIRMVLERAAALQPREYANEGPDGWGFEGYDDEVVAYHVAECRDHGWMVDVGERNAISHLTYEGTMQLEKIRAGGW